MLVCVIHSSNIQQQNLNFQQKFSPFIFQTSQFVSWSSESVVFTKVEMNTNCNYHIDERKGRVVVAAAVEMAPQQQQCCMNWPASQNKLAATLWLSHLLANKLGVTSSTFQLNDGFRQKINLKSSEFGWPQSIHEWICLGSVKKILLICFSCEYECNFGGKNCQGKLSRSDKDFWKKLPIAGLIGIFQLSSCARGASFFIHSKKII